jgi:hypothetical protein
MSEGHKNIYEAILGVYKDVAYVQKGGEIKSKNFGYTYAGERDLINACRPPMVKNDIIMYVLSTDSLDVKEVHGEKVWDGVKSKNLTFVATVTKTFRFVHTPSGSFIDCQADGQGSDTMDKAVAKASTNAYKYALRQTFCIETGDETDAQASPEEVIISKEHSNHNADTRDKIIEQLNLSTDLERLKRVYEKAERGYKKKLSQEYWKQIDTAHQSTKRMLEGNQNASV